MTTLLTSALIDRCHAGSRNKGFWDETPPQGQQLMLVISELAEALEAHRKGRNANFNAYHHACDKRIEQWEGPNPPKQGDMCCPYFESYIKDSVGDELADAYIRLCDFVGGYGYPKQTVVSQARVMSSNRFAFRETFGENLLCLTTMITGLYKPGEDGKRHWMGTVIAALEALCEREGIDLATHIDLKLRYNATRPAKHGKAY